MVNYGADEVSALVLDIGTSTIRAGYAGDDTPKAVIPTSYGYIADQETEDINMDDQGTANGDQSTTANTTEKQKKMNLFVGQHGPSLYRAGMEIGNPMQDAMINDFAPISSLIRHTLVDSLGCDPTEHPILVTEPAWNTPANRERMAEIMFEEFQVPAFYICNTGVLNAFAAGKGTAFVIDIGHTQASVTPVVDGFVLRKGMVHASLPEFVRAHAKHLLASPSQTRPTGIDLTSHQLIASKKPVDPGTQPIFTLRQDRIPGVTSNWRKWYEEREVDEWLMSVAGVMEQGWNDQVVATRPPRHYEFPNGYNTLFGSERFYVGEQFFTHNQQVVQSNPNLPKALPSLISQSLSQCEADLRTVLLSNVVLCGGGSLFAGLADRLSNELTRSFTHAKIHAPGNPTERRFGGWLGGSILASLGTFHQLWISKEEWHDHGKSIVAQRCK